MKRISKKSFLEGPTALPLLVIEDDSAILAQACTLLEESGYPVVGENSDANVVQQLSMWQVAGILLGAAQRRTNASDLGGWLSQNRPDLAGRTIILEKPIRSEQLLSAVRKSIGAPPVTERILVVDDDEPIREIMRVILAVSGYRSRAVPGGEQALKLLESGEAFDLATTDIVNSPIDGYTFLEHLKNGYPEIPVLTVTAAPLSTAQRCIRLGADDYLMKPFGREQLFYCIRRALEHRRLTRENRVLRRKLSALTRKT